MAAPSDQEIVMPSTAEELALLDVDTVLHRAADRLADKYSGVFSPETASTSPTSPCTGRRASTAI
jgi:hypothetical protein